MKKLILILGGLFVLGVGGVILFVVIGIGGIFGLTAPVVEAGDGFLNALKAGQYEQAYNMLNKDAQAEVGGPENLQRMIESNNARPKEWSFHSRSIDNNRGRAAGSLTFADGSNADSMVINVVKVDGKWKVYAFHLK